MPNHGSSIPVAYLWIVHKGGYDAACTTFAPFAVDNSHMQGVRVQPRFDGLAHTAEVERQTRLLAAGRVPQSANSANIHPYYV